MHSAIKELRIVRGGAVFEEGMVTTDEPGIYIEGKYGIRLENELVCQKRRKKMNMVSLCILKI